MTHVRKIKQIHKGLLAPISNQKDGGTMKKLMNLILISLLATACASQTKVRFFKN